MLAWHFVGETLRDGRPIPEDGVVLVHDGPLVMCRSGLHASSRLIDALEYAPGWTICRVRLGGDIYREVDKAVATERTILWRVHSKDLMLKLLASRKYHCHYGNFSVYTVNLSGYTTPADVCRVARMVASSNPSVELAATRDERESAWRSVRSQQNRSLTSMVCAAHRKLESQAK